MILKHQKLTLVAKPHVHLKTLILNLTVKIILLMKIALLNVAETQDWELILVVHLTAILIHLTNSVLRTVKNSAERTPGALLTVTETP
jgi:hypothetical protein